MKNKHLSFLIICLLALNLVCLGQDKRSLFDDFSFNKKSNLRLTNCSQFKFSQNYYPVIFHASLLNSNEYPVESVATISDEKSNVEKGAIIGGISGLLVGVIAGGVANPDDSAIDIIGGAIAGNDVSGSLNQDQVPYIVGGVLVGVTAGILISAIRGKTAMYEKKTKVEFQPVFAYIPDQSNEMILTVRWNFN